MREAKTHSIDGFNYTITQLGAKAGRLVLARVMRSVAGAAGKAAGVATDEGGAEAALVGIAKLVESLSDEDVTYFCDVFAKTTMVAREETPDKQVVLGDAFDDHFAGRYGAMSKWLWAALETNFASFLSSLGLDVGALADKVRTATGTPTKSSTAQSPTALSGGSSSPASAV
jgi:hypothetical protein